MILKRTVFFLLKAGRSSFLWVRVLSNRLLGLLYFVYGFFYAFLVLANTVGFDLIIFIEGKSFLLRLFLRSGKKIFGVVSVFSPDGRFYHSVVSNNFIKASEGTSKCSIYITMINHELYLEVKNKWKSLYPIYFDASKTIQEGTAQNTQAEGSPSINASKIRPLKKSPGLSAPASSETLSNRISHTPEITFKWVDSKCSFSMTMASLFIVTSLTVDLRLVRKENVAKRG